MKTKRMINVMTLSRLVPLKGASIPIAERDAGELMRGLEQLIQSGFDENVL